MSFYRYVQQHPVTSGDDNTMWFIVVLVVFMAVITWAGWGK